MSLARTIDVGPFHQPAKGPRKLIADLLFEISALDPATSVALPIGLMTLAVLTCALPAWRAARMNPATKF